MYCHSQPSGAHKARGRGRNPFKLALAKERGRDRERQREREGEGATLYDSPGERKRERRGESESERASVHHFGSSRGDVAVTFHRRHRSLPRLGFGHDSGASCQSC